MKKKYAYLTDSNERVSAFTVQKMHDIQRFRSQVPDKTTTYKGIIEEAVLLLHKMEEAEFNRKQQ